jgi:hypothetical protein
MIRQSMRDLTEELGDEYRVRFARTGASTGDAPNASAPAADGNADPRTPKRVPLQKDCNVNVLVLPAHDEADEIVGLMLAQLLDFNNYCAEAVSTHVLAGEMAEMVQTKDASLVCVSALPPSAIAHSRYLCKRLHLKYPDLKMVVGLWTVKGDLKRAKERITCDESALLVTTLSSALDQIEQLSKMHQQTAATESTASPAAV